MRRRQCLILALSAMLIGGLWACDRGSPPTGEEQRTERQEREQEREDRRPIEQPEAECPLQHCFTMLASLGWHPRLAIWSVGYGDVDYVQIRNLFGEAVNFDGWYASNGQEQVPMPEGITIEQSAYAIFHIGRSGRSTSENIYLEGLSFDAVGEFALFSRDDFEDPDAIQVYVRWGADPDQGEPTHMPVAAQTELWRRRGYVPLCEDYSRFGAVGDNALPRGFRSMPNRCFPELQSEGGRPR